MTTIAYKRGVIACDKQATEGGTIVRCASKAKIVDGKVYCISGSVATGLKFIRQLTESDEPAEDFKATVVCMDLKTGKATVYEGNDEPQIVEDVFYAWGSGGDVALGALAMGASPAEAVRIASKWDTSTGLGVQEFVSERARGAE